MREVRPKVTIADDAVQVVNVGPGPAFPPLAAKVLGFPRDTRFVIEWSTFFSPVHNLYRHYFMDPRTGGSVGYGTRTAVFFNPVGPETSEIFAFLFTELTSKSMGGLGSLILPVLRSNMNREFTRDMKVVAKLADKRSALKGFVLGRMDKALVAARQRVDRIYHGIET